MKLISLTKKEAKIAEEETTPISNIAFGRSGPKSAGQQYLQDAMSKMFDWKYTKNHDLRPGLGTTAQNKAHITKHLGQPLYHACYEYREAVWGFTFGHIRVICYYSTKGFSVQVDETCSAENATKILKFICSKLEK